MAGAEGGGGGVTAAVSCCWRCRCFLAAAVSPLSDLFSFGIVDAFETMSDVDGSDVSVAAYFNVTTIPSMIFFQVRW